MTDNELDVQIAAFETQGWKVERGLSGYVLINPQGEMEWWRGVDCTRQSCWKGLIDFPHVPKPNLSGASNGQRGMIDWLFSRRQQDRETE